MKYGFAKGTKVPASPQAPSRPQARSTLRVQVLGWQLRWACRVLKAGDSARGEGKGLTLISTHVIQTPQGAPTCYRLPGCQEP